MDKFGSHVVDACWGNLDMIQKVINDILVTFIKSFFVNSI